MLNELEKKCAQLEKSMLQSEERFFKLFHASSNLMAITTVDEGRIVDLNEAYARFTGYKREELVGQTTIEHGIWADPKQRDAVVRKLQEEGKVHNLEVGVRTKAGSIRTILFSIDTITLNSEPHLLSVAIDITDRKHAEEELRESEEKYRILVDNSLQGLAIIQDSRFVFCNKAFAATSGYSVEELLSFPDSKALIHADDQEFVMKRYHDRLAGKPTPPSYEYRTVRKDGSTCWLEINASLMKYKGKPAVQIVHMDITKRKQAENALRESEERFRLIAETIDEIFWIFDLEKEAITYVSPAHERIWGYPVKYLYENRIPFFDPIHPDDREQVAATMALIKTGQTFDNEYRIIRPDGSVRRVWNRGFPVSDKNGRVHGYVGVGQDVTARREAEEDLKKSREYLNKIINCIGDPIFVKDHQHRFLLVNDADCTTFNWKREEAIGKTLCETLPKELIDSIFEQEDRLFETGEPCVTVDEIDRGSGCRVFMTNKTLLTDDAGNKQIVGVMRDITEYKRLEAQLLQAQKIEAVGMLAGGVAHDFNNLLSVIKGYTELLMEDLAPDDPKRPDLEQIEKAGQRAASLTSQLLAFSRRQILHPEIMDLNAVITDMSTMLRRLIGEDIELKAIAQPDLGPINADPGQVQQIIMNLAVNSRDAMPQGGKLTIETANVDLDEDYVRGHPAVVPGPYVMIAVSDNGIGMDAANQARIFEPFFTTKEKGKGTGLGLATVYGIVKQSNGFIWVYSELGKGTTFKIYFPRAQGEIAKHAGESKSEIGSRGFETVLLAEDESSVRALAARILHARGYAVLEAADGKEALRIAQEFAGKIHLILTDVVMPGMSGRELVSRLEAARPKIKSLYVSGYTDDSIVHHGILDSNVAFLQKPFSADGLTRKVREAIDS